MTRWRTIVSVDSDKCAKDSRDCGPDFVAAIARVKPPPPPPPDKVLLTDTEARVLDHIGAYLKDARPTRGKRAKLNPPPRTDK
jgi:hypothetical protein